MTDRYTALMPTASQRQAHRRWLLELTAIPTAPGHEDRVISWVETWLKRRRNLSLRRYAAGNLLITRKGRSSGRPIFITAHLDHPAFVVRKMISECAVELEFRGGVHDPYFDKAKIEIATGDKSPLRATIAKLDDTRLRPASYAHTCRVVIEYPGHVRFKRNDI